MSRSSTPRGGPPPPRDPPPRDPERIIPAIVVGLGEVGRAVARAALHHPRLSLVGAVDLNPKLVGRSLEDLGVAGALIRVEAELAACAPRARDGVALLCTGSRIERVAPAIEACLRAGLSVVTTCEEMAYPWLYHEEIAARLERAAQQAGRHVLGTGVNPGFVLDRLVATAAGPLIPVQRLEARRVVDVRRRRPALQKKVGAGLSEAEFEAAAERDELGHIGLAQSCALAALGVGLDVDEVEEELSPVIAEEEIKGGGLHVRVGQVAGVFHQACGFAEGAEVVRLELTLAAGSEPEGDWIRIEGESVIELEVKGGYPGETATAGALVNAVPSVVDSEPGLLTVLDLPAGR